MNAFQVGDFRIGRGDLTVIAGPCMAESPELCRVVADRMQAICARLGLPYIFKASFDKANRTSIHSERGPGLEEGVKILAAIKTEFGVPVTTDIHLPEQAAPVAEVADILQIPAFLCRQTDLLVAAAETGRPVNVKKGQFLAPGDTKNIVTKLQEAHAQGTMLTERGTSFGYRTLVVDMPGLEQMRALEVPVCFDATHSAQRPGGQGTSTGGARETIPAMVRAAVAVGIDALFLEVHPDPEGAMSDSATQWPLDEVEALLANAVAIHRAANATSSALG